MIPSHASLPVSTIATALDIDRNRTCVRYATPTGLEWVPLRELKARGEKVVYGH